MSRASRAAPPAADPPAAALPSDVAPAGVDDPGGRSLIRSAPVRGGSMVERATVALQQWAWRTPLHGLRLRGRHPLRLMGVPTDPVRGDPRAGAALLEGQMRFGATAVPLDAPVLADAAHGAGFVEHVQSFAWLRDLAVAAPRELVAPIAEGLMRRWLERHARQVDEPAWRADLWGRRILAWTAHAPLILSSLDLGYRTAVLNTLARGARHLDRTAEKAPAGVPRVAALAGQIAAGLLIPGGEPRAAIGEAALLRALAATVSPDGGVVSRSPVDLLLLIELLSMLVAVYEERRREVPAPFADALGRAVPALLGVTLGDGRLSSWQGAGPLDADRVARVVAGSGVRTRPQRQSRDWGYQRLSAAQTVVVADCAPPPASRVARGGCASTLAFELADGAQRIVVNCGGDRPWHTLPRAVGEALRTTAAHSTLTLADSNSTAIHADGTLGRGVSEVALDRREEEQASRVEASHDGYVRRHGLIHRRTLRLASDGRELAGDDVLIPGGGARGGTAVFAARFHLGPGVEATATADGMAALLRLPGGTVWMFRCRGAALSIEESLWIDSAGQPVQTVQLVAAGETPPGGTSLSWVFKRAG